MVDRKVGIRREGPEAQPGVAVPQGQVSPRRGMPDPIAASEGVAEPRSEPVRPPRSPEIKAVSPDPHLFPADDRQLAAPRGALDPSLVPHPDFPVARVINPPVEPIRRGQQDSAATSKANPPVEPARRDQRNSLLAPTIQPPAAPPLARISTPAAPPSLGGRDATQAASPVRPPLPSRAEGIRGTKSPEPIQSASPSQPAVQVSIGRVEVRAVFPEPPARRPASPRSRPTVSLDDYLNRRNRGRP